jgi:hypothetical protein
MVKEVLKYWPYLLGGLIIIAMIVSVLLLFPSEKEKVIEEEIEEVVVPDVIEEVLEEIEEETEEEEEEETTTTGGSGGGASDGSGSGSGSGGGDETEEEEPETVVAGCEDSSFPLIESVTNGGWLEFCYDEVDYILAIAWMDGQVRIASHLEHVGELFEPMDYEFGEDDDGRLMHGRVNKYDIDEDGSADLFMKPLYADQETGEITFDLVNLDILIHTEGIENCLEEDDEDDDGLMGCEEPECHMVYGFYGPEREDDLTFCTYGRELLCEDNFDNDGNGEVDELDSGCLGLACSEGGYWTWTYLYGEDQSEPPPFIREGFRRIGCCEEDQCVEIDGSCIDYDDEYTTLGGDRHYICGDRNLLDRCGAPGTDEVNKEVNDWSDGDQYVCQKDADSTFYWKFWVV